MIGSIGKLAEQVLQEIRSDKIVKLAQYQMIKEAQEKPRMHTEIGRVMMKLAEDLRGEFGDVTVSEFENFINEADNAE